MYSEKAMRELPKGQAPFFPPREVTRKSGLHFAQEREEIVWPFSDAL